MIISWIRGTVAVAMAVMVVSALGCAGAAPESNKFLAKDLEKVHAEEQAALRAIYDGIAGFQVDDDKHVIDVKYPPIDISSAFTDAEAVQLAKLTKLKRLGLPMMGSQLSDRGMKSLATLSELEVLMMNGSEKLTRQGYAYLASLKKLKGLGVAMSSIDDEGLANVAELSELQFLDLTGCKISDHGVHHLAGLQQLQTLALVSTGVTDRSLEVIAKLPQLADLDVRGCNVTDEGCAMLAAMPKLKTNGRVSHRGRRRPHHGRRAKAPAGD